MRRLLLTAGLLTLALACGKPKEEPVQQPPAKTGFPQGFLWGTSIAGFQVDMGCPTLSADVCEDKKSDWWAWVTTPELIADKGAFLSGQPLSWSPGHWELYEKDFDLAKNELAGNALRMSIEWSRIFPTSTVGLEGNAALAAVASKDAIAHYHAEFAALKARGLKPLVTLNHYTLPSWIHDAAGCHKDVTKCSPRGWLDKDVTIHEIAKYAGFVAAEFKDDVDLWATENEPFAVVLAGYLIPSENRTNPPGLSLKFPETKAVTTAMIEAHARMYDAVKANDPTASVGLVYAMLPVKAKDPAKRVDVKAAENLFYLYNQVFLNAVIKGDLDETLEKKPVHRDDLANRMDWLGVNYYFRATVEGTSDGMPVFPELSSLTTFNPLTLDLSEIYAKGLYDMVMVGKDYGVPTYVTENGFPVTDDGSKAVEGLVTHLTWLERAVRDGADVRGYFYWSLMDNYEWNHGMDMRFGLYAVDPKDAQKTRKARPGVAVYQRIASGNAVPDELKGKYPQAE